MNTSNRLSDFFYVASGFVEAAKALGVIICIKEFWANYFNVLSFNIDLISAFSSLLAPWSILYLQRSKNELDGYSNTCFTLIPVAVLVSAAYFSCSVYFVFASDDKIRNTLLLFLLCRALSLIVIGVNTINFLVMMRKGRGGQIFLIQVLSLLSIYAVYIFFSEFFLSWNLFLSVLDYCLLIA